VNRPPARIDRTNLLASRVSQWRLIAVAILVAVVVAPVWVALAIAAAALAVRASAAAAARWRRRSPLRRADGPDRFVLGVEERSGRSVVLGDGHLAAHGLILGASGSGKSTTLLRILSEEIARERPVVAIDLKGSPGFAYSLERAAAQAGRSFRIWTLDGPDQWNPLAAGNPTEMKDKLIATERFTEPHYQRAAERYAQQALRTMTELEPDRPVTLARVVELLDPDRLLAVARGLEPRRREDLSDYLRSLTRDQLSAIRGLASRLAIITESHTGAFLGDAPGGIDLRRSLAEGEVVLFSLNSATYGQLAAQVGTLVVQDLVTVTGARLRHGDTERAFVAIDEFSALGSDNVMALVARAREAGISVFVATQELVDLDRAARGLRDQVSGNTGVKIAHRQDVPESAAAVSRMAGTVKTWERSYHEQPAGPILGAGLGLHRQRGSTARLVEKPAIDAEQLRSLPTGQAVVITKTPEASARVVRVTPPSRDGAER